jgi:Ankyrin repeats (3 copies)/Ankyrin repeat
VDSGTTSPALHQAAERGDIAEIRQRLDAGDAVDIRDDRGMTPLHHAAVVGRVDAAGLLLDRGADPNAREAGDMTPLHFAAMLAHPELAGLLMRRGARADIRNASGLMPIHLAANEKVVNALALAGADVNALTSKGFTPLHTARHGLVAKALIDHKADLRIRTPRGRTAMETAGIETLERVGLSIHSVMLGRLRGIIGQMPVTLTNVSNQPLRNLVLIAQGPSGRIEVTPVSVPELLPGQNADMVLTLTRNPTAPEGEHPIYLSISAGGNRLGNTDLKVDTRMSETPEDRGMIRLAKGQVRPASSRWFYLVYASVPLLVVAAWLFFRRRSPD